MITVARAGLEDEVAGRLIGALDAELSAQYPEEGATHFRLGADEVAAGRGAFLVAYDGDRAIGCGGVRRIDGDTAELKRMYVVPAARGRGVGRALLGGLEAEARRLEVAWLVLETGERQAPAIALYERAGFVRIPRYGEYATSPLSVCLGKMLGR